MYDLGHAVLNERLPPPNLWMNMGYWEDQQHAPCDFPKACEALLIQVLSAAFLTQRSKDDEAKKIQLLDIGFGCGDQTLLLLDHQKMQQLGFPNLHSYVGINSAVAQHTCACKRIAELQQDPKDAAMVMFFCENAADPKRWSPGLRAAAEGLSASRKSGERVDTWVMGLDSLLHLSPSRLPLLHFACDEMQASLMAYDLIRADPGRDFGWMQPLLLRLVCKISLIPHKNIMLESQYRQMLVDVGYSAEDIEIRDVSQYVFNPLHEFMSRQENHLRGLGRGLGVLRIPKWIFGWFGRSGVVRGCVIVARNRQTPD